MFYYNLHWIKKLTLLWEYFQHYFCFLLNVVSVTNQSGEFQRSGVRGSSDLVTKHSEKAISSNVSTLNGSFSTRWYWEDLQLWDRCLLHFKMRQNYCTVLLSLESVPLEVLFVEMDFFVPKILWTFHNTHRTIVTNELSRHSEFKQWDWYLTVGE